MLTEYYIKRREFRGSPRLEDFGIMEGQVDEDIKDGEILTEALCLSVDPFIRDHPLPPEAPIDGFQIARVLESKNGNYPKGCMVLQKTGWQTICVANEDVVWYRVDNLRPRVDILHCVSAVGMPGLTAYFGLLDICKPKPRDTVFVSGCASAVGSIVGQIAVIKGCRAVGCCGSDDKVRYARSIGFFYVFNYKKEKQWSRIIRSAAKDGIDCFFDNVGGQLSSDVINHMNENGRIAVCGSVSFYHKSSTIKADIIQPAIVSKQLKMEGVVITLPRYKSRFPDAIKDLALWVSKKRIRVHEVITDDFENVPYAFLGMLHGENFGKALVRLRMPMCACEHSGAFKRL